MSIPKFEPLTEELGDLTSLAVKLISLPLLESVLGKYERSAAVLRDELAIAEIRADLIMQVCLAAPAVDDLVLGFIRDDLRVVSRSEQTKNVFERDLVLAQKEAGNTPAPGHRNRTIGEILLERSREAKAKAGKGQRSELDGFIKENQQVYKEVSALSQEDLTRWVMLSLMREMENRRRGSLAIAVWKQKLAPEIKQRVEMLCARSKLDQSGPKQSFGQGL